MLGEIRGEVRFKEPLSFHTSLRIGGPADFFIVPQDVEDIRLALAFADKEQLPVAVVGGGPCVSPSASSYPSRSWAAATTSSCAIAASAAWC